MHETFPRGIPSDAALWLFRIVQEGLRNVKKHRGASSASVRIEFLDATIHLTISDEGKGFELGRHPANGGIGIWSMHESDADLWGKTSNTARLMRGTRIDAWLPFKAEQ